MTLRARTAIGLGCTALAAVTLLLVLPTFAPSFAAWGAEVGPGGPTLPTFQRSGYCGWDAGPQPAAVHAGVAEPTVALQSGDSVTVAYQIAVQNYSSSDRGIVVHVPSVFGIFPTQQGTPLSILVPRYNLTVAGAGYSNLSQTSATKVLGSRVSFPAGGRANLTSEKLAVQATIAKYGALTLQLRWRWITNQSANGGGVTSGAWSNLTYRTSKYDTPTIFLAAPFVALGSHTGATAVIGTNYSAALQGAVARTTFNLEIENASGTIYRQLAVATPVSPPVPLDLAIYLMGDDNAITPGGYLFHLHDHCGAILYSVPVKLAFPSSAALHLSASPTACGPITYGRTSYASGSSVAVAPSTSSVALSVGRCSGYTFNHWDDAHGADVTTPTSAATSVVTSANGSAVAVFS